MRSLLRRRTVQFALVIPGLMAGWAASAGAELPLPPPPPVTVPTVTIPTVTVPTVTVPPVPQPPQAPAPPTVPGVTLPSPQLPAPPQPTGRDERSNGGGGGPTAPSGSPNAGGSGQSSGDASAQSRRARAMRARVHRLRLTRDWISIKGPKRQRWTTLVFALRRPSLVEFVVVRVSPDCHRIGRFRVRGHRGVNRIRLSGSIGHRSLVPGTYRFVARTLPGGRTVVETRLVVVQRSSRREIRTARGANACRTASDSGSATIPGPTDNAVGAPPKPAGDNGAQPERRDRGVLGERLARQAFSPVEGIPAWLIALSVLAVGFLLAAALLPRAAPRELITALAVGMTGAVVLLLLALGVF